MLVLMIKREERRREKEIFNRAEGEREKGRCGKRERRGRESN
jgi:hypothetical protein